MPEPNSSPSIKNCHLAAWILALLYILLLALPLQRGSLLACDLAVPFMAIALAFSWSLSRRISLPRTPLLFIYVAWSILCLHGFTRSDLYEWAVFAYMAVLFTFFSQLNPTPKGFAVAGTTILACALGLFFASMLMPPLQKLLFFTSTQMDSTAMSFLSRRYAFGMSNPNLFALYYPISFALLTPLVHKTEWCKISLGKRLFIPIGMLIVLLPIASSASKHGLLTLAILLSWLIPIFQLPRKIALPISLACILASAAIFEITVLFVTFPTSGRFPFINTDCGMYRLHQSTYTRMITDAPGSLIRGLGIHRIHLSYPQYADPATVKSTLEQYNAMASYDNFISFMDPHNEYLNQLSIFGLPALLLILAFWLLLPRISPYPDTAICFVIAVLCCCLWDDLLSKRAVWTTAALLIITPRPQK